MLRQEVRKAWRVAGLMVQSALEVGFHKERYYRNSHPTTERSNFLKRLMACVVDLDKRCSFMTNLPYHLRCREIDDSVLDLVRCLVSLHKPSTRAPSLPVQKTTQLTFSYKCNSTGVIRFCRRWLI